MKIWRNLFGKGDRIHSDVIDVNGEKLTDVVNTKADKQAEGWKAPTLLNGWENVGGRPLRYRLNSFGELQFRGRIDGTNATLTEGTMLFRLPVGYRVTYASYVLVMSVYGRNLSPIFLSFNDDGNVELYAGTPLRYISFENITIPL